MSQNRISIKATSKKTGLTHIFDDIEKLVRDFEAKQQGRHTSELINGKRFYDWLRKQDFDISSNSSSWTKPVYRVVSPGILALSIAGSLADGGRFNVGGAQQHPLFSTVKKAGCLYAASSIKCALAETAKPLGQFEKYKLSPNAPFQVWDLQKVVNKLDWPGLNDLVNSTPIDAIWGYQKVPLIPQLLASHLRSIGGDGIKFKSVKDSSAFNLSFFFRQDKQCAEAFALKRVE
jgi:hypothetical protein